MNPQTQLSVSGYPDNFAFTGVPVDDTEFLDMLTAYRQTQGQSRQLDLARKVLVSYNYFPYICGWPEGELDQQTFAPFETKEGSVTINARSILLGMTSFCNVNTGMKVTVTDKGSGLGIGGQPLILDELIFSQMEFDPSLTAEYPAFGPLFLRDPVVVTPPGQFQVSITNLSPSSNAICQIALMFAVPATNMTLNTVSVLGGSSSRGKK